jgi:hemerythrin
LSIAEWKPEYSVGVESVDWEHQQLFAMMNELHDAIESGHAVQAGPMILTGLIAYTREHFANEENLMLQANYPDFDRHKAEHDRLSKETFDLIDDFSRNQSAVSLPLLIFLRDWWRTHILTWDQRYTSYLHGAGLH